MTTHVLKCHPFPFDCTAAGFKPYEVRVNDRNYHIGDGVELRRWDPDAGKYTGQRLTARIGHVTAGGEWGLPPSLCVFSLLDVQVQP